MLYGIEVKFEVFTEGTHNLPILFLQSWYEKSDLDSGHRGGGLGWQWCMVVVAARQG
jgi:phosphoribosylamine-glycine ligase